MLVNNYPKLPKITQNYPKLPKITKNEMFVKNYPKLPKMKFYSLLCGKVLCFNVLMMYVLSILNCREVPSEAYV